jgi:hypothetical protein
VAQGFSLTPCFSGVGATYKLRTREPLQRFASMVGKTAKAVLAQVPTITSLKLGVNESMVTGVNSRSLPTVLKITSEPKCSLDAKSFMYACKIKETANGSRRCARGKAGQAFQVVA